MWVYEDKAEKKNMKRKTKQNVFKQTCFKMGADLYDL